MNEYAFSKIVKIIFSGNFKENMIVYRFEKKLIIRAICA